MTHQPPLFDPVRHGTLRDVFERERRHLEGDHTLCRTAACLARRLDQPPPRDHGDQP